MFENVNFTNMCMVYDADKVLVIDRKKKDWSGITFPGGHVELGSRLLTLLFEKLKRKQG